MVVSTVLEDFLEADEDDADLRSLGVLVTVAEAVDGILAASRGNPMSRADGGRLEVERRK